MLSHITNISFIIAYSVKVFQVHVPLHHIT